MTSRMEWNGSSEAELRDRARKVLVGVAQAYERELQLLFRAPKHGRLYGITAAKLRALRRWRSGARKTRPSGVHRASAAGEAPAIWSGRETQSIGHVITDSGAQLNAIIGTSIDDPPYPMFLEFGTSRMAARPAWVPALETIRSKFADIVRNIIGS